MKFGFIGAGKVGCSLGKYLAMHSQEITGYYSMYETDAREAAEFTGSRVYESMVSLVEDSEVLFLTVPDGQIENVWTQLKAQMMAKIQSLNPSDASHFCHKIVCHCSGALSSEVFSEITGFASYGYSIHPLFAVSDKYHSYKELSNSYFTIEGAPEKIADIRQLLESFGNPVCVIDKAQKVKYHAAAAMASNLMVGLMDASQSLLTECGFEQTAAQQALAPIMLGNLQHILSDGTVQALTGPIERNDVSTVQKHLNVLQGTTREIYVTVSKQVLAIAKRKHDEVDYTAMERCLTE